MESEKAKEIKKALEKVTNQHCTIYLEKNRNCKGCEDIDLNYCDKRLAILTLTLINELESENERLKNCIATLEKKNAKYNQKLTTNQWVQEIRKDTAKEIFIKGKDFYKTSYHKNNAMNRLADWIQERYGVNDEQ